MINESKSEEEKDTSAKNKTVVDKNSSLWKTNLVINEENLTAKLSYKKEFFAGAFSNDNASALPLSISRQILRKKYLRFL